MQTLKATPSGRAIRRIVLEQSKRAGVGHIGSALSIADIVACLYGGVLRVARPDDPDRDRFILSKGHAALALYAALHLRGWLSAAEVQTFCSDGSALGVHPERTVTGIDFSTGSLGLGLCLGTGAALAARLQASARRVFVLLSDAELNAGAVWEAAMFAAHHRLGQLIAIVDANGQQALGKTRDILDLEPLAARWRAFGWDTHEIDGHDPSALAALIASLDTGRGHPHAIIARTTFGKGVSYMENRIEWHYSPMSDEQFDRAMAEQG